MIMKPLSKLINLAKSNLVKGAVTATAVAVLLFLATRCGNNSNNQNNTVTSFKLSSIQVEQHLGAIGINPDYYKGVVADGHYALPTEEWVRTSFSSSFKTFKDSIIKGPWVSEENDCDDFARAAAFFAQLLHHNTQNKLSNTGLAIGEFWYTMRDRKEGLAIGAHAINFILVRDKSENIRVLFFEPQISQVVELTDKEIRSCFYWRL